MYKRKKNVSDTRRKKFFLVIQKEKKIVGDTRGKKVVGDTREKKFFLSKKIFLPFPNQKATVPWSKIK